FVFFAAFAAAFFLRLAIAALLAMDHGGCRISTRRESTRAASGLLQHEQKNSVTALGNVYSDTVRRNTTQLHDRN
ncbi:MAG: hypothetical protein WBV51_25465, partial [Pseudolabrys sp.]